MFHNFAKRFLPIVVLVASGFSSTAQNATKENAPYSRYGIGEFRNSLNTAIKGMGSIGTAYASNFYINSDNPASYANLRLTAYEVGGEGRMRTVTSGLNSYKTGTATLSYLTVGMPVGKKGGFAFGMRPETQVYYKMNDTADIEGLGPTIRNYSGEGGMNYAFVGGAYKHKGFSIGLNFGYLFGTIRNSSIIQKLYDTANTFNSDFSKYYRFGGIYWKMGALYETPLDAKTMVRFGLTTNLGQNVNVTKDEYAILWRSFAGTSVADTAMKKMDEAITIKMPFSYALGVQFFQAEKWMAGLDFTTSNWSQFRINNTKDSVVDRSFKLGVGGEYTPNATSSFKIFQRTTYRLGFYYGRDYVMLQNKAMDYWAFTTGLTVPFHRPTNFQRAYVHLGLEVGKRDPGIATLIKENFVRFSVGFTLNDRWFVKRRYE